MVLCLLLLCCHISTAVRYGDSGPVVVFIQRYKICLLLASAEKKLPENEECCLVCHKLDSNISLRFKWIKKQK